MQPQNALAQYNLAITLEQTSELESALIHYGKAIAYQPNYLEAHYNRGALLKKLNRLNQALNDFDKVLQINPNIAQAYGYLGNIYKELGDPNKAIAFHSKAIDLNPAIFESFFNRGKILLEQGKFHLALKDLACAIQAKPEFVEAHYLQGVINKKIGEDQSALNSFSYAIKLDKYHITSLLHRSKILMDHKAYQTALHDLNQIIEIEPTLAEAHHNRGMALEKLQMLEDAIESYEIALKLKIDSAETYNNLGNVLRETKNINKAIDCFERAIKLRPDYAAAHSNLGWTLNTSRHLDASIKSLRTALDIEPNLVEAHLNIALSLLASGAYLEGFKEYEWRHKISYMQQRSFSTPLWLGNESLKNKTILLYPEQGLGDTIQFSRYAKLIFDLGAKVILEVQAPLHELLQTMEGVDQVISSGGLIPNHDFHCPLMSLPLAFKTEISTIPCVTPYIKADQNKVLHWKNKLGQKNRLRVGLVWSGGFRLDQPELWAVNERRNIPFAEISKLNMAGVEFHSLQKGDQAEVELKNLKNLAWPTSNFFNYIDEIKDFSDTAAYIENLDLIISVDTSTAHLAGALGKPVFLMNRFDSCWRWSEQEKISAWYPTIRIFNQTSPNNWDHVLLGIRKEIINIQNLITPVSFPDTTLPNL